MRLLRDRKFQRGQSLVEFALIVPTLLILVLGVAEMGFAFGQDMSIQQATREGARVGASLANGSKTPGGAAAVDPLIIASVERALVSTGGGVDISKISSIHIYKSNSSGGEVSVNTWTYDATAGPTVDGYHIHFKQGTVGWAVSSRSSTLPPDSIGVSIQYDYSMITPLKALTGMFGANKIHMSDATVMAVEPL